MRKFLSVVKFTIMTAMLSSLSILAPIVVSSVPANPFPHNFTQPCGTVIECVLVGDEFFSYTRTLDGYVIAFDSETGYFCYAKQVDFLILPTNLKVGVDSPPEDKNALTPEKLLRSDMFRAKPIQVYINGESVDTTELIEVENNAIYLPLRLIFEELEFMVEWEDETQTVVLSNPLYDKCNVSLQIASDFIILNEKTVHIENCAKLVDSRTLLPLSIFTEILGEENISVNIGQEKITIDIISPTYPIQSADEK